MLAFKAWRESRARFLLAVGALGWFASMFVLLRPLIPYAHWRLFADFVVDAIYAGSVRNIFVLLIVPFGLGGLTQEVMRGSAPFTLALPVTRTRLVMTRAVVGWLQVAALAFVPTVAVVGLGRLIGEHFSVRDALLYSVQWAAVGMVLFALAFLLSIWVTGAYAALSATILVLATYVSILNIAALRSLPALNVFALMERTHPGGAKLAGATAAAVAVIAVSAWATERQDF